MKLLKLLSLFICFIFLAIPIAYILVLFNSESEVDQKAIVQYNLGVCYSQGIGVKKSSAKAFKWYRSAAEQGHVQAKKMLKIS